MPDSPIRPVSDEHRAGQATVRAELERQIMDPNVPKNEREWWANTEIASLRAQVERLEAELERRSANEKRNCQNWGPCSKMDEGGTHAGG